VTRITASRVATALALTALVGLLLACGTTNPADSQWQGAQTDKTPAVTKEAIPGKTLNKYFPTVEKPYELVPDQDKPGTAIYKLEKNGKQIATLSINDTFAEENKPALKDFEKATDKLDDKYPLLAEGKNGHKILVADRFQVKIRNHVEGISGADILSPEDHKAWLNKFDLAGLATLK
jgi:hypothetical protein